MFTWVHDISEQLCLKSNSFSLYCIFIHILVSTLGFFVWAKCFYLTLVIVLYWKMNDYLCSYHICNKGYLIILLFWLSDIPVQENFTFKLGHIHIKQLFSFQCILFTLYAFVRLLTEIVDSLVNPICRFLHYVPAF